MKLILFALLAWLMWRMLRPKPALSAEARARRLLGVTPRDDADAIRAAHRRLMAEAHPDRGGSPERARALNAARDTLLADPARHG